MNKIEETEKHIRIPVAKRKDDDRIRTIDISKKEGISALYAANRKLILTYIFLKTKGWTVAKAQAWVKDHKKSIEGNNNMKKVEILETLVKKVNGKMTAIASDDSVDRMGDSLEAKKWDLKNFKKNPVLQLSHNYMIPPVGIAKNIRIEDKKLLFDPEFHEITQQAREVKRMYEEGIMRAFSVGFMFPKDEKGKYELLEISAVTVPANPNALILEKKYSADRMKEVTGWVCKNVNGKIECKPGENIEDKKNEKEIIEKEEIKKMEKERINKDIKILQEEISELKEGKILSKKNRELINSTITNINKTVSTLESLLDMSEPKGQKKVEEPMEASESDKTVLRALQKIAKNSNFALNKLKKGD